MIFIVISCYQLCSAVDSCHKKIEREFLLTFFLTGGRFCGQVVYCTCENYSSSLQNCDVYKDGFKCSEARLQKLFLGNKQLLEGRGSVVGELAPA